MLLATMLIEHAIGISFTVQRAEELGLDLWIQGKETLSVFPAKVGFLIICAGMMHMGDTRYSEISIASV